MVPPAFSTLRFSVARGGGEGSWDRAVLVQSFVAVGAWGPRSCESPVPSGLGIHPDTFTNLSSPLPEVPHVAVLPQAVPHHSCFRLWCCHTDSTGGFAVCAGVWQRQLCYVFFGLFWKFFLPSELKDHFIWLKQLNLCGMAIEQLGRTSIFMTRSPPGQSRVCVSALSRGPCFSPGPFRVGRGATAVLATGSALGCVWDFRSAFCCSCKWNVSCLGT